MLFILYLILAIMPFIEAQEATMPINAQERRTAHQVNLKKIGRRDALDLEKPELKEDEHAVPEETQSRRVSDQRNLPRLGRRHAMDIHEQNIL